MDLQNVTILLAVIIAIFELTGNGRKGGGVGMIDRDKVIKGMELLKDFLCDGLPGKRVVFNSYIGIVNDAIALLKEQERKMGSWDNGTQCSLCKGTIIPPKDKKIRVNFCPWCGADMRDSYEQEGR